MNDVVCAVEKKACHLLGEQKPFGSRIIYATFRNGVNISTEKNFHVDLWNWGSQHRLAVLNIMPHSTERRVSNVFLVELTFLVADQVIVA